MNQAKMIEPMPPIKSLRRFFIIAALTPAIAVCSLLLLIRCADIPVQPNPLRLHLAADSTVMVHDTFRVTMSVPDAAARNVRYLWRLDGSASADTTADSLTTMFFYVKDTGVHRIIALAIDKNRTVSAIDTLVFRVVCSRPALVLRADTTAAANDSFAVTFSALDVRRDIAWYAWYVDDPARIKTSVDSIRSWVWKIADTGTHRIVGWAVNRDTISSSPCSLSVRVGYRRPVLSIKADTIANVNVPYRCTFSASGTRGPIAWYAWYIDNPAESRVITDSVAQWVWGIADTGLHHLIARAADGDSMRSLPCSLSVRVVYSRPAVKVTGASIAYVNVPYTVKFIGSDADHRIAAYQWYIDDSLKRRTTLDSSITLTWSLADTGRHNFVVRAIDSDGVRSLPDTLSLRVMTVRPVLRPQRDTVVKVNDSLAFHFSATDSVSMVTKYRYFIDAPQRAITTTDSIVTTFWHIADAGRHMVVVEAASADSAVSIPDTFWVTVTYKRPHVTLRADTLVATTDTAHLVASAADPDGRIDRYLWSIEGFGTQWFSTVDSAIGWVFGGKIEMVRHVKVVAIDNDGFFSDTASAQIHVTVHRPEAAIAGNDTAIFVNQELRVRAIVKKTYRPIVGYKWMVDGRVQWQSVFSDSLLLRWGPTEAGAHLVSLAVTDADSMESVPDTMLVKVETGTIVISPLHDTTIRASDTLRIVCKAVDGNPGDSVVKYLWNFSGGAGWDDSTALPNHLLAYTGKAAVRVIIGARDRAGSLAIANFNVFFNRPPSALIVIAPAAGDTFTVTERVPTCLVSFSCLASDPDNDSLEYSISWGPEADALVQIFHGRSGAYSDSVSKPGRYYWKVEVRDPYGQSRSTSGIVTVVREYRICFIGHSVVVGFGGDGISGGFRGGVIDSLRKNLGPFERLKVVGPYTTTSMSRSKVDDSCMAINGTRAREILLMLANDWPQLAPDIWVLMIGVNGDYSPYELDYTTRLVQNMALRNPAARLYVFDGLRVPEGSYVNDIYGYLPNFNYTVDTTLADTISARVGKPTHLFPVHGYAALSPEGLFDTTVMAPHDNAHPNQIGYDRLRDTLFTTMKNSIPPAIPKNP
jgi:hypothetical protein